MTTPSLPARRIGFPWTSGQRHPAVRAGLRFAIAFAFALFAFALIITLDGANAGEALRLMIDAALGTDNGRAEVLVKLAPFALCAAAVAIPAQAGLINVGGEGQFYIGAWAASGVILYSEAPTAMLLPLAFVAAALGGAAWAAIPAFLRLVSNMNEAISTLLLNYVAVLFVNYFVYGPWKDPASFNWPFTAEFPEAATLPVIWGNRVHAGIFLVPVVLVAMFVVLRYTRPGFELRAVGGNLIAAQRAGISVKRYLFGALVVGGAVAGLAGLTEVTGIQGRLRPGISVQYGFVGFLASWLGGHRPIGILLASLLFGAIAVGGDSLQLGASLPASTVNILMALLLFAVLAGRRNRAGIGGT